MGETYTDLTQRYGRAAPRWSDKMRALGYFDAYLGFLADHTEPQTPGTTVVDIGAGTGAMAEAWVALHGQPARIALLDPSEAMLSLAGETLLRRNVQAELHVTGLEEAQLGAFDVLLAAHVIEHFDDPLVALTAMRGMARTGSRLYLTVSKPHWCNAIIWLQWRHRTFRHSEIVELLHRAGFAAETQHSFPAGPPSRTSFGIVARAV